MQAQCTSGGRASCDGEGKRKGQGRAGRSGGRSEVVPSPEQPSTASCATTQSSERKNKDEAAILFLFS